MHILRQGLVLVRNEIANTQKQAMSFISSHSRRFRGITPTFHINRTEKLLATPQDHIRRCQEALPIPRKHGLMELEKQ